MTDRRAAKTIEPRTLGRMPPPASRGHIPWKASLLCVVVLLGAGLRFYDLGGKGLSGDERHTIHSALYGGRAGSTVYSPTHLLVRLVDAADESRFLLRLLGDPPLPAGEIQLKGHTVAPVGNDLLLRLPFAVVGTLSILAVYQLGRVLLGSEEGLIGALLLALSPLHIMWGSQIVRYYVFLVLLSALSAWSFYSAIDGNRLRDWVVFTLSSALGIHNVSAGFFPLASLLSVGGIVVAANLLGIAGNRASNDYHPPGQRAGKLRPALMPRMVQTRFLPLLVSTLIVLMLALPLVGNAARFVEAGGAVSEQAPQAEEDAVEEDAEAVEFSRSRLLSTSFITSMLWQFGGGDGRPLYYSCAAAALVGLVACAWEGRWRQLLLMGLWLGLPFLLLLSVLSIPWTGLAMPKHFIFLLPVYLVAAAKGITSLGKLAAHVSGRVLSISVGARAFTLLGVVLFGAMGARSVWQAHLSRPLGKTVYDYPLLVHYYGVEAASYLDENVAPGDAVVFAFNYRWNADEHINYYSPPSLRSRADLIWMIPPLTPSAIEEILLPHSNVWIVGEYQLAGRRDSAWIVERVRHMQTIRRVPIYLLSGDPAFQGRIEVQSPIDDGARLEVPHFVREGQAYAVTIQAHSTCSDAVGLDVELNGLPQGTLPLHGAPQAASEAHLVVGADRTGVQAISYSLAPSSECEESDSVYLNWLEFEPVTVAGAVGITRVEAEDVSFASGARTGSDQEGRGYVSRYTGGAMVDEQLWFEKAGRYTLTVMAKNEAYAPVHIEGRLDGALLGTLEYGRGDESWSRRSLEVRVAEPGTHRFTLEFAGPWIEVDYYGYIDWFEFRPVDGS